MDDLLDIIVADEAPSNISDKIKDILFAKAAEKVEYARPIVSADMFGLGDSEEEEEVEEE